MSKLPLHLSRQSQSLAKTAQLLYGSSVKVHVATGLPSEDHLYTLNLCTVLLQAKLNYVEICPVIYYIK